jgi:hypothetical protein
VSLICNSWITCNFKPILSILLYSSWNGQHTSCHFKKTKQSGTIFILLRILGYSGFLTQILVKMFWVYFICSIPDKSLKKLKCDFIIYRVKRLDQKLKSKSLILSISHLYSLKSKTLRI